MTWEEIGFYEWAYVDQTGKIIGRVVKTTSSRAYLAFRAIDRPLGEYISIEQAKTAVEKSA